MIEQLDKIGLYWQPLGGNNIDQISGHCYRYTDCSHNSAAFLYTTIIVDIGKFDNYQALGIEGASAALPDIRLFLSGGAYQAAAIFITHSHPDHLNGLVHYLKLGYKLPPVYMGRYSAMILEDLYAEFEIPLEQRPEIRLIQDGDKISVGTLEIEVLASSHTCFDSFGLVIKSASAIVYHTGDMKLDSSTYFRKPTNLRRLQELAGKIDAVVADFYGIVEEGFAIKEVDTFKRLVALMKSHRRYSKIFIPVYPTHPEMYIIAFLAALKLRKNVVFYGSEDFYSYLHRIIDYGIDFEKLANNRIRVLYHPDGGLAELDNNYVVIGTYNYLAEVFRPTRKDSYGIITAKTFFNPLKGQFNIRSIQFTSVDEEPKLQGFGHGFLGDYEKLNQILGRPLFIPTHCPRFVIDNFRELGEFIGFRLLTPAARNKELYRLNGKECIKVGTELAEWLVVRYDEEKNELIPVEQKATSGQGFLKRTISNRRCARRFKMILNRRRRQAKEE